MTLGNSKKTRRHLAAAVMLASAVLVSDGGLTQGIEDEIVLVVGYGPGGAYDISARVVADHLPQFIPGDPNMFVTNEPGAGGLRALREYLATGAADGTELLTLAPSTFILDAVLEPAGAEFDPLALNWIGATSSTATYCIATAASGVTNLDEMLAADDFTIGSIGLSGFYQYSQAINRALGGHFRFVTGFDGIAELNLAMARGEIDGVCGISYSSLARRAETVDFVTIAELAPQPTGLVEGAEFLLDRITDPLTREALLLMFRKDQVYYPVIAHPDTPDEVVAVLQAAFAQLATDPAFLEDARSRQLDPVITDGPTIRSIVEAIVTAPEDVQERLRELVAAP